MSQDNFNQQLLAFLQASPTPYHAVHNMVVQLEQQGFQPLAEAAAWSLKPAGRYYVTRNGASLIAFTLGDPDRGMHMVGAHTDSPCLKVKPTPDIDQYGYQQLGVEVYGGALLNPWFDRDLSIAGRVHYLTDRRQLASQRINFDRPIAVIPSLAIHLDREANNKRTINPQTDIVPIVCQRQQAGETPDFRALLKQQLLAQGQHDCQTVMAYDLSFYDTQPPAVIGLHNEFIASARLDNLLSCFVGLQALSHHTPGHATALLVCNDHEEVGSQSATGAQGPFLKQVLARIVGDSHALARVMQQSLLISTDNAHGIHPNYGDRHDQQHGPVLNRGPVIKSNANQRYATNDETAALFQWLCQETGAAVQYFVNRADRGCGSTIGPLTASALGVRTLDIGLPTFGMHSIRELAGTQDAYQLSLILSRFFAVDSLPLSVL